jgi:phospholipase/lecithinase/hemolysin
MRTKLYALSAAILIAPLCGALASSIGSINQIIAFGDSLSDNGNAAAALGPLWPANYAPNALTDGPNTTPATTGPFGLWIDQLAPKLGLPDPKPFVAGGTNYAVASALTGSSNLQDIGNQVSIFSAAHLIGGAPSNALYVFWGGANDIFDASNPSQAASQAAFNLNSYILKLAGEGAKDFLWLDLAPLGDTPRGTTQNKVSAWNTAAALFNSAFQTDVTNLHSQGIQITGVRIDDLYKLIASNPSTYGFTNITDPAQGLNVNPNTYLFWDDRHPTTAADALIAKTAFDDLTGMGPGTVPEPSSMGLLMLGLCGVLAIQRLRRKA